jgi:flavorubredoxin
MNTRIDEIGDQIYCISTFIPEVGPRGFSFNQILVNAREPLLFHCGMRGLFPAVREAVARVLPPERLRWIGFSHVEADECGSMNAWLATAPHATVVHGEVGCRVSLNDLADRAPRALADGDVLDLGDRKVRLLATPQVPHNWEAVVLFEERTRTLLAGDIVANDGDGPAMTSDDISERVLDAERMFRAHALGPATGATLERLAALEPRILVSMHGRGFEGDCAGVLRRIGAGLEELAAEVATGPGSRAVPGAGRQGEAHPPH